MLLLTISTNWSTILFVSEQYKLKTLFEQGGAEVEKDCGAWINLLSHKVKARLNITLHDLGITGVQSRVIYYILVHCQDGLVFQRDIENAFRLSRSTATGILQLLERNGIIRRESVASDARLKSLVPTQHAAELDAQVRACLRETDRMLTRGIPDSQLQLFKEIAAQMLHNLDEWDAVQNMNETNAEKRRNITDDKSLGSQHPRV